MTQFPEELEVSVTTAHLNSGNRLNRNESPLALAACDALRELGIEFTGIRVTEWNLIIYTGKRLHRAARYYIPDDAAKLVLRHAAGRRVKPGVFTLPAIYRRDDGRL